MKIVQARHEENNKNYYFVTTIEGLKKGDNLIVDTKFGLQKAIFFSYVDFESLDAKVGVPNKNVIAKVDALNRSYWDSVNIISLSENRKQQDMINEIKFEVLEEMYQHEDNERIKKEVKSDAKANTGMRRFLKVIKKFQAENKKSNRNNKEDVPAFDGVYTISSPLLDGQITIEGGVNYVLFRKLMIEEFGGYTVFGASKYYNLEIEGYDNLSMRLERKLVRY